LSPAGGGADRGGSAGESPGTGGAAGQAAGGRSGTGGVAGGEGGATAGQGGSSGIGGNGGVGGAGQGVEYRACLVIGGVTRILVYRLDRAASTCVALTFHEETDACPLGLTNNGWCLRTASIHSDIAACESLQVVQGEFVTSAAGSFNILAANATPKVDFDLMLEFEESGAPPLSVHAEVASCSAACGSTDCRL
jgi:hypothetical protein